MNQGIAHVSDLDRQEACVKTTSAPLPPRLKFRNSCFAPIKGSHLKQLQLIPLIYGLRTAPYINHIRL